MRADGPSLFCGAVLAVLMVALVVAIFRTRSRVLGGVAFLVAMLDYVTLRAGSYADGIEVAFYEVAAQVIVALLIVFAVDQRIFRVRGSYLE